MSTNKLTSSNSLETSNLLTLSRTALSIRTAQFNQLPQRITFDCFANQKFRVVERMHKFGGNASRKLAAFMLAADDTNLEALVDSTVIFEDLISKYLDGGRFDK